MYHSRLRLSSQALLYACRLGFAFLAGVLLAASASATGNACNRPITDVMPLLERMEQSWNELSDYTAYLHKTERFISGAITEERALIKFRKPNQLYLRFLEGSNAGAELLFPKVGTDSVILARPGGASGAVAGFLIKIPAIGRLIPYEFDLHDERLMSGQHHPLPDSSLAGMMRLISVNLRTAVRQLEGSMCFHPGERVDGKRTTKFEVHLPAEVGFRHTVAEGETLWTIGAERAQDRYVILYNNPSLNPEQPLAAGTRIYIPRYYAPRALIWVSEAHHLPLRMQMFDIEGRLYEAYSNIDLRIDVGLTDEDFDAVAHGFPAVTRSDEKRSASSIQSR